MVNTLLKSGLPDENDMELARRVASGDHAAFELLMRRHNRTLFRTARAILRDVFHSNSGFRARNMMKHVMRCHDFGSGREERPAA